MLKAARDEFLRDGSPDAKFTFAAQERWGWFLLDHGEPAAAAGAFNAVLAAAHGMASVQAAMAAAGRLGEARALAGRAVAASEHTEFPESVRLAHAKALLASLQGNAK